MKGRGAEATARRRTAWQQSIRGRRWKRAAQRGRSSSGAATKASDTAHKQWESMARWASVSFRSVPKAWKRISRAAAWSTSAMPIDAHADGGTAMAMGKAAAGSVEEKGGRGRRPGTEEGEPPSPSSSGVSSSSSPGVSPPASPSPSPGDKEGSPGAGSQERQRPGEEEGEVS